MLHRRPSQHQQRHYRHHQYQHPRPLSLPLHALLDPFLRPLRIFSHYRLKTRIFVQRLHLCVNSSKMRTVLHGDGSRKFVGYDGSSLTGVATRRTPLVLLRPPSGVQVVITLSLKRRYKLLYAICVPSPSRAMALVVHLLPTRA
jgi:hypothetical protein